MPCGTARRFHCIGKPKRQNLLLYPEGLRITYETKDGRTVSASDGDVVYTPVGSEYTVRLLDFQNENSHTVGINFLLYDETGEEGVFCEDITVFRGVGQSLSPLFHRAAALDGDRSVLKKRTLVFEILSSLSETLPHKSRPLLSPALQRLTEHPEENPSVAELARLCGISQVYFRRLFREEYGMAPAAYRNRFRLERAARYLEFGQISVQEISDTLGYGTASHFIKEFRLAYGCSPAKYRKAFQSR